MKILSSAAALENSRLPAHASRYPSKANDRVRQGLVFPLLRPKFYLSPGERIFTLGSCFARNIERTLPSEFVLPTREYGVPQNEWPHGPTGILNEYNPGTMCRRIEFAAQRRSVEALCVAGSDESAIDLLLPDAAGVASLTRVLQRRQEIDSVYHALFGCSAIIVTLGLIEAWYDTEAEMYLNRMPPPKSATSDPGRYQLHILDVEQTFALVDRTIKALLQIGIRKILLTVSPVPFYSSFSGDDAIVANTYSKSVLRASANRAWKLYSEVDYFPSYEMVILGGPSAYADDNIHVANDVVAKVTSYMVENYVK
jgi:hypothetical protein